MLHNILLPAASCAAGISKLHEYYMSTNRVASNDLAWTAETQGDIINEAK